MALLQPGLDGAAEDAAGLVFIDVEAVAPPAPEVVHAVGLPILFEVIAIVVMRDVAEPIF